MKKIFLLLILTLSIGLTAYAQKVITLNDSNFESLIGTVDNDFSVAKKPFVIDFSATWCGPCKQFAPIYQEVAKEYGKDFDFYVVDIDKSKKLSYIFGIRAVPTTVYFNPVTKKATALQGLATKSDVLSAMKEITE